MGIEERRRQLKQRFNPWRPLSLGDRLDAWADAYGERPLVVTDDVTLSYRQVQEESRRLAAGLLTLGVRPGDRVAILMANLPEFVPIKFAIARVGAIAVPLNFRYKAEELGYVLEQCGCSTLFSMTSFEGLDYIAMLSEIGFDRDGEGPPALRDLILVGAEDPCPLGALTLARQVGLGDADPDLPSVDAARPGDMLYTSGTTGSPKGVLVTHDAVQRTAYASALTRAFEDGRRVLCSLPCYHMFGYVEGLLAAAMVGGALVMQPAFDAGEYLRAIEEHRADDMLCVPTMTVALLEHTDRRERDLGSLRALLSGAAPAPAWLWERVQEELGVSEMTTGYGMTECGGAMTLTLPEDPIERHAETVGRPKLADAAGLGTRGGDLVEYRTADPVTGEILAEGTEGELISRGPTMMLEFWGKAVETAETLRGEWVYSGDLGRVRPDGYIEVTGRSKELYKSGGELVMPKEIEELVCSRADVSQAFAVGLPDERWGEVGCLWVVPSPGAEPTDEELVEFCREHLARFKVPRHVLLIAAEELPKTPTGKVRKFQLVRRAQHLVGA